LHLKSLVRIFRWRCAAWRWRANVWLGRSAPSLVALDRWIAAAPNPSHYALRHARATRAHVLGGLGRWNKAAQQLATLASERPTDAVCHFNWGYALQQTQAWDLAERAFQQAVRLSPSLDLAWYGLGEVLYQQGRWVDAEAAWLRQSALQPHCPDGLARLVDLYVALGRWPEAEARLLQLKAFDPQRAWLLEPTLPRHTGSPEVRCA
jgi:tetratricopeptide (TPR) repeat protein